MRQALLMFRKRGNEIAVRHDDRIEKPLIPR
jgi:hypothetical protein